MHYELISADEYDELPEEPDLKFAALEQICRRSMNNMLDDSQAGQGFFDTVYMQYMTTVAAAAEELISDDLFYPNADNNISNQVNEFMLKASGIVTRIRLRASKGSKALSTRLGTKTRGRIEQQIQRLREIVVSEPIPESKRKAVLQKLDDLSVELSRSRVSFAKVMSVIAHVSVVVASGTTFLADAPHAIATITFLLGQDKIAEEEEMVRLGPPPKQKTISAPSKPELRQITHKAAEENNEVIDDDIPF